MSKKQKIITPAQQLAREISYCEAEYRHWQELYQNGCGDPTWEDGANLFLTRNHIAYYKQEIERICNENNLPLPEIYNREYPPEVPIDYMARPDEIRENSGRTLNILKSHADYIFLQGESGKYDNELNRRIAVVIGYVSNLEYYIANDKLVDMRRYERPDIYLESFRDCLRAIDEYADDPLKIKPVQLSLI